jgi:hypothetical protein
MNASLQKAKNKYFHEKDWSLKEMPQHHGIKPLAIIQEVTAKVTGMSCWDGQHPGDGVFTPNSYA